jgi:hypothetical protein
LRTAVLTIALLFIAMLTALTINDLIHYGVTPLDVLAWFVLALFAIGIIGALRQPPQEPPED